MSSQVSWSVVAAGWEGYKGFVGGHGILLLEGKILEIISSKPLT